MTSNASYKRGYSLIEVLVYLSVMVLVSSALITTFLSLDQVFLRNKLDRALTHSATLSLERMSRAIRSAESVNVSQSTLGSSPGVLTLTEGATTTRFEMSGDALVLIVNGTEIGPLTSEHVSVRDLTFTHYAGTETDMVRVALTLSASSTAASSTRTYYTSAVLRGSYE